MYIISTVTEWKWKYKEEDKKLYLHIVKAKVNTMKAFYFLQHESVVSFVYQR